MKKKALFITAGVIALALVALIVAGSTAAFAQGGNTPSKCNPTAQTCQKRVTKTPGAGGTSASDDQSPGARGTITSITGSTVTVQAKDRTSTLHLTASTTYQKLIPSTKQFSPASQADLAVGEMIQAEGTLNGDGSLQATAITIFVTG